MNKAILFTTRRSEIKHLGFLIKKAVDNLFADLLPNTEVKWVKMYIIFTDHDNIVSKRYIYIKDNPNKISKNSYLSKIEQKTKKFFSKKGEEAFKEFSFYIFYEAP
jgi:hypothetical protein